MVSMQTADNALKSFYLDAVCDALNTKTNPFLAKIKKTSDYVVGKDVRKLVRYGVNGGIGAGTETGDLPEAGGSNYVQFVATLKNLYGTIEISDKAIRAAANNEGAFVNLLNDEMESLIKSSSYNFGRMLFGDGSGKLATVSHVSGMNVSFIDLKGVEEGMIVDFYTEDGEPIEGAIGRKIKSVDRDMRSVTFFGNSLPEGLVEGCGMYLQHSFGNEISGLGALFGTGDLYGVKRSENGWMKPFIFKSGGGITENLIQTAIDTIEEKSGSKVNMIICSNGVKRAIHDFYAKNRTFLPHMEVEGGFTALNMCGVPVVADRFCPEGTMYLLNTDDFKLHQLCDWQWLEGEDGKILKQVPGKPVYTATLVKYAELVCERPNAQGVFLEIEEL